MRKVLTIILTLVLVLLCSVPADAAIRRKITSDGVYELREGEKVILYVKTDKTVKWTSSDKSVATITKKGVVTAKGAGETVIKAKYGKKTVACTVIVDNWSDDLAKKLSEKLYIEDMKNDSLPADDNKPESTDESEDQDDLQKRIDEMIKNGTSTN